MGLGRQLAQGQLGAFARLALGPESGVAQTRATVFAALITSAIAGAKTVTP